MAETDAEYVERYALAYTWAVPERLINLARDGATLRAEVERLREAGKAIIDFHNAPLEVKRPDIFHRLMVKLSAALQDTPNV